MSIEMYEMLSGKLEARASINRREGWGCALLKTLCEIWGRK